MCVLWGGGVMARLRPSWLKPDLTVFAVSPRHPRDQDHSWNKFWRGVKRWHTKTSSSLWADLSQTLTEKFSAGVTCPIGVRARLTRVSGARPVDPCPIDRPRVPINREQASKCLPSCPKGQLAGLLPPPLPLGYGLLTHTQLTCLQVLVLQGIFYTPSTNQEKVL